MMLAAYLCLGIAATCGVLASLALLVLLRSRWSARQRRIAEERIFPIQPVRRWRR